MDKPQGTSDIQEETAQPPGSCSRQLMRLLGLSMIALALLLAFYLAVFYLGWQSGQSALVEQQEQALARQVMLARDDIGQGNFSLALLRLEWVLAHAPGYPEAHTLQEAARAGLSAHLTPMPTTAVAPTATAAATPIPETAVTPALPDEAAAELQRIRRLMAGQAWEEAANQLIAFQITFPDYERPETDQMLYDAYVNLGLALVNGHQVERALYYFSQAEKLGQLPEDAVDYRSWAELYLQGMAFYGVNWDVTAGYFRDLCLAAPFYHASCDRLLEALVARGDQYTVAGEWCPAQALYEEARQYGSSQALINKLNQAREGCLAATPTPLPEAEEGELPPEIEPEP